MDKKRRYFLKLAGASTLAGLGGNTIVDRLFTGTSPIPSRSAQSINTNETAVQSEVRMGMIIDLRKFKQYPELIEKVIQACHKLHNVPDFPDDEDKVQWIRLTKFEDAFDEQSDDYDDVLVMCNHCENPPCVQPCPTRATFKRKDGIIVVDYHRCIGCRLCIAACPYGSRSFNWRDPREGLDMNTINPKYPTRRRGVVEGNCNFCIERLAFGKEPACVEACRGVAAIIVGDLNDPNSEISIMLEASETIQSKPSLGTNPSIFYIV